MGRREWRWWRVWIAWFKGEEGSVSGERGLRREVITQPIASLTFSRSIKFIFIEILKYLCKNLLILLLVLR